MIKPVFKTIFLLSIFGLYSVSAFAAETILESPALKNGKAMLVFADAPLKTMTEIPFAINITDDAGDQIKDATLQVSMDMPAMPMPPNNPEALWKNEAYRGVAIFTMAGSWELTIDIERSGSDKERVVFSIEQVMMQ